MPLEEDQARGQENKKENRPGDKQAAKRTSDIQYIWTVRKQVNKQTSNPRARETSRQVVRVRDSYLSRGQHVERKVGSEDSRQVARGQQACA
jgi:hypothetical protein